MGLLVWIDFILFLCLFALFAYVFATVTITNLHKVYLIFHFFMMVWPYCQFAIKTTENLQFQLFYVKLAFIDSSLLTTGWLLFTIFLTGKSHFLQKKKSWALFLPTIAISLAVIINPYQGFVQPVNGGYAERTYGPIFWLVIAILILHVIISFYLIYLALVTDNRPRIKKQVAHVLKGIFVVTAFILMDIFLNVFLAEYLPVIPGMTSLGILLSAVFFVVAIHRDKVFDIVTIAHHDIIDTIAHGILVLDDNENVVEINQSLLPFLSLRVGDHFDMTTILSQGVSPGHDLFLQTYKEDPLTKIEIEVLHTQINRQLNIQAAPIIVSDIKVGRIITFQDMTELRRLIDETNLQNGILQERNQSLIEIQEELFLTNRKLKQMAITDSLTGCYNRHYLTLQLEHEVVRNVKYQTSFAIFLLDIDHFKTVNDNYGHLVGDDVICSTVNAIKQTLRPTDILARYGGEEFIVYLPNTNPVQANLMAESLKSIVASSEVYIESATQPLLITVSIGVLSISNFADEEAVKPKTYLNDLFESVDKALYQAKNEGRNRIVSILK